MGSGTDEPIRFRNVTVAVAVECKVGACPEPDAQMVVEEWARNPELSDRAGTRNMACLVKPSDRPVKMVSKAPPVLDALGRSMLMADFVENRRPGEKRYLVAGCPIILR
jgi:hypothetical protein